MKTLLVPTDFSSYASRATQTAAQIAQATGARVILLSNIVTELNWKSMSPSQRQDHPETLAKTTQAEIKLEKLVSSSMFKNLEVSKIITHGMTYERVVSHAKHLKADLIVLGSHGNEASDRFFIGSNIQKIMREADCPVLAIKNETQTRRWKKIVFAAEFDNINSKSFDSIKRIAAEFKSRIYLLYVNMPTKFKDTATIQKQMNDFANKYPDIKFEKGIYNQYELEDGVLEYASQIKADMIAMITHNRRNSPAYRIGATESLVFRSTTPVLSVSPSKEGQK
jgi:nucleotide-binding universal stress UspA family protein